MPITGVVGRLLRDDACSSRTTGDRGYLPGSNGPEHIASGDHTDFLAIADSRPGELWNKFNVERDHITVRVCYCFRLWTSAGLAQASPLTRIASPAAPHPPAFQD